MRLGLSKISEVNDLDLLKMIKIHCYLDNDVRPVWIGAGIPHTDNQDMVAFANWATQHWAMYYGFLRNLNPLGSFDVLDVGCACGHSSNCLSSVFVNSQVVGIDISTSSITFANKYNKADNLKYICDDFFNYSGRFDYIFALEILEHLPHEKHFRFVDRCLSLLSPGGSLFITTPNALDEEDGKSGHIGLLNRSRVKPFLDRYGNRIKESAFYNNKKLLLSVDEFTVSESIENFEKNSQVKSHFKIVMS
ncbi:MAG: hypothetical protein BV459_05665 [Thermoplasmata archaeon M11B2D]|nr:MAG: hypothetical protein BV459_05665 [Thermoplasmata archaeon M11B2D]